MRRLVTADEMRAMDHEAIANRGVPGYELMEAAGHGVAEVILEHFSDLEDAPVVILAGRGNNGGDGFVVARALKERDLRPVVILVGAHPEELTGDAAQAYRDWTTAKGETLVASDGAGWEDARGELEDAELIVDALLGTGSRGAPRGLVAQVVEELELLDTPIVAVDIPTGLDADTGEAEGVCIHADLTVTMALPKRGHFLYPGRSFSGELRWVDIGIPEDVLDGGEGLRAYVVEPEDVIDRLPDREPEMHKGDRGRLLVIGGSAGLTGAVTLAAEAAVRAGAGLVTAGVPLSLNDILEVKLTEAMTLPLPELDVRSLSRDAFDSIAIFQPGRLTALAVGPGAGRHPSTQALVRRIIREIHLPTVLDADGLFAFNGQADLLRLGAPSTKLVLTPHAGEFIALTGEDPAELRAHRLETASKWARRLDVVLVLKGAPTVIADPASETVYVNPTGSEALATGGTGDVLTGFISGFLAQGVDPLDAAIAGVYLHGWTADFIVEEWGSVYGLQAGDLIEWFPLALGFFLDPPEPE
jgi:NAD(P)H-hydrate epimerase